MKKVNLNFVSKFFRLLVQHPISPTNANNVPTWNRAVLLAAMVAGIEIEYARVLIIVIHNRAFNTSTTYPLACLIFHLFR